MVSVGKVGGDVGVSASTQSKLGEAQTGDRGPFLRNRHQKPVDDIQKLTRFAENQPFDLVSERDDDQVEFMRRFSAALERNGRKSQGEGSAELRDVKVVEERIIGFAEQRNWTGLPTAAPAEKAAETPPKLRELVDKVTQMIVKSISAEAAPRPGQSAEFRFALPEGQLGLSHIRVVLTSATLDVVLERQQSLGADDLAGVASALADRLLTRFSKRAVRIIEQQIENAEPASSDDAAIAQKPSLLSSS